MLDRESGVGLRLGDVNGHFEARNLRDKAASNGDEVVGRVQICRCQKRRMRRRRLSRVALVGVKVVYKVLRQEHVLVIDVTKDMRCKRAWSYLREPLFSFT
jgi:hypothetical protein